MSRTRLPARYQCHPIPRRAIGELTNDSVIRELSTEILEKGYAITLVARGRSMNPTIRDQDSITVIPLRRKEPAAGQVILAQAGLRWVAHRVVSCTTDAGGQTQVRLRGDACFDGDAHGDDLVKLEDVLGEVISTERGGRSIELAGRWATLKYDFRHLYFRSKRGLRRLIRLAPFTALLFAGLLAVPAHAGSSFQVGSFTKSTGGAPVSQTVTHTLGVTPKAMILWTTTDTNTAFTNNVIWAMGITDGTTNDSFTTASQNNHAGSVTSRGVSTKLLTIGDWTPATLAECDFTSWSATNFVINWTTNNATAYVIHYILIGGTDIKAKVANINYQNGTGNQATTGVGFKPDVVFFISAGSGLTGTPPVLQTAVASFDISVMDAGGKQWANSWFSHSAANPSVTWRAERTDAALITIATGGTVAKQAKWVSMDADGFTVNYGTSSTTSTGNLGYLALKGVNVHAGSFAKSTGGAPASQSITGLGFAPKLLMMNSYQSTADTGATTTVIAESRKGFGAGDGTTAGCVATIDQNNVATTKTRSIDKTTAIFMKVDNNTPAIDAQASLSSLDSGGFTLNWTTNDAVGTEMLYLALGSLPATDVEMESMHGWRDSGRGASLVWETGREVDSLGFRVYRDDGSGRVLATPSLIAGSAMLSGAGTAVNAGNTYRWSDTATVSASTTYWIEEVNLTGRSSWHGPIAPQWSSSSSPGMSSVLLQGSDQAPDPCATREPPSITNIPVGDAAAAIAQRGLAELGAIKINVREPGWYRVGQPQLIASGLDPAADPNQLRLFFNGRQQPMVVVPEEDGSFGPNSAIEFYAPGIDTPSTDISVYWLTTGRRPGLRIATGASGSKGSTADDFIQTMERRDRKIYFPAVKNGDAEKFFGDAITESPKDLCIRSPKVDNASLQTAHLVVTLQGATLVPHQVAVSLNGALQGEVEFSGQQLGVLRVDLPASALQETGNTVRLTSSSGPTDISLLQSIELSYPHRYQAETGMIKMTVAGPSTVSVSGFTSSHIRAMDVSNPFQVRQLPVEADSSDGTDYVAHLSLPSSTASTVLVFDESAVRSPLSVAADQASFWSRASNQADLVAIAPQEFLPALQPLKAQREREGLKVALVAIEDIYDEFSFGEKDVRAIRAFLEWAQTTWSNPPKYVLLAGDASFDPRNYLGLGDFDRVPSQRIQTASLETATDDWFTDFDGDGVADIAIGRLPGRNAAELATMVAKTLSHVPLDNSASKKVVLIADKNDGYNFEGASRQVGNSLPANASPIEVFRGTLGDDAARAEVARQFNSAPWLLVYSGHGSEDRWAGQLLTSASARGLTSRGSLGVLTSLSCLNGYFTDVYGESLAKALVKADQGGAVAVWASSTLTSPEPQVSLGSDFIRALSLGETLGQAAVHAKSASADADVRGTWILFGDPSLRMTSEPLSADQPPPKPAATWGCQASSGSPLFLGLFLLVMIAVRRPRTHS